MTDISSTSANPVRPRRPWFQFSLRTLLLAMLVFGCGLSWFADKKMKSRKAWKPIRMMQSDTASFALDGLDRNHGWSNGNWLERQLGIDLPISPRSATLWGVTSNGNAIAGLSHLKQIESVRLEDFIRPATYELIDDEMSLLSKLPMLNSLKISSNQFTGEGLRHFAGNTRIRTLDFSGSKTLSSKGISSIEFLPSLETLNMQGNGLPTGLFTVLPRSTSIKSLDFSDTYISDYVVVELREMQNLKVLNLRRTKVTDVIVGYVGYHTVFPSLKEIDVRQTRATAKGIARLKARRPQLTVHGP